MTTINCLIDGAIQPVDSSLLTPFRTETDNENEHVVSVGWLLNGVVVQNDVHMTLKKAATFAESAEGSLN